MVIEPWNQAVAFTFCEHDLAATRVNSGGYLPHNIGTPGAAGLYFFAGDVGRLFGGKKLLGLYLLGGVVGSLAHCGW